MALLIGGVGLSLQSPKHYSDTNDLFVFSTRELAILAAVAQAIVPRNGDFPSALELKVPEVIDRLLAKAHPAVPEEIRLLLHLLENAAVNTVLHLSPTPFSKMPLQQRSEILAGCACSGLVLQRKEYKALNGRCQSSYYAQIQVREQLGYECPPKYLLELVQSVRRKGGDP